MKIDNILLDNLLHTASDNPRMRINLDLRTSEDDNSQRMLNALLPGTEVAVHRHPKSAESILLIKGHIDVILYDQDMKEIERCSLSHSDGVYGCQVPPNTWHTIEVYEPSVIFDGLDHPFGEDGSESY